jgi:hypothetical protein
VAERANLGDILDDRLIFLPLQVECCLTHKARNFIGSIHFFTKVCSLDSMVGLSLTIC